MTVGASLAGAKAAKVRSILEPGVEPPPGWATYLPHAAWDPRALLLRYPRLYALVHDLITPTLALRGWQQELPDPATHVVVNLGCGYRSLHRDMVNLDLVQAPHVDVPADLRQRLPIRTGSVDGVLAIAVLEHVEDPGFVVAEMARILKPGGLCYVASPFAYPFHAAPHDYHRWTRVGMEALLVPHLEVVASAHRGGAAGLLILLAAHLVAQLLCFGSARAYAAVNFAAMALLSPLKLLDLVLARLPFSAAFCPNVSATGRKR